MNTKNLTCKALLPGYGTIVAGSVLENLIFRTNWFLPGSLVGLLWSLAGLVWLVLAMRELKKGEGYMLVQSGPFARTRNPVIAANLLAVMPGLCLTLNTNIGILGIFVALALFYTHVHEEEVELEERFGASYAAYRERVCCLLPCPLGNE